MPKPKDKETVVWDDDDMWSDVEDPAAAEPAPEPLAAKPAVILRPEAEPATQAAAATPTAVPLPVVSPSPMKGVSLTKIRAAQPAPTVNPPSQTLPVTLAPIATPKPSATSKLTPPPLPMVPAKAMAQAAPVVRQSPPPLPLQAPAVPKPPARKPPGGVSSIFLRGETNHHQTNGVKNTEPKSPPKPKAHHHPKLGPAFARELPPENEA